MMPVRCSQRNQKGVTLMEMMIILVIIGVMAAMAVPQWLEAMPRLRAQSEAREVVSTLRTARSLSISRKELFGVSFSPSDNLYKTFINRETPGTPSWTPGDSLVDSTCVGREVALASQTFPTSAVVFNPDGSASASGAIALVSGDSTVTFTIDVLASTGRIRLTETPGPPST